jgi:hypothetical protein
MDNVFPSRKEILEKSKKENLAQYQESIVTQIKSVDVEKIDFSKGDFKPRTKIAEKQKVFLWIRLFLSNECLNINPDDTVKIKFVTSGESLDTKFICYSKKGADKDDPNSSVANYNTEDDKKVLCLMVDSDKINYDNADIPFIKTLFKTSRFYQFQLLKREDLQFINVSNNQVLEYYDVTF